VGLPASDRAKRSGVIIPLETIAAGRGASRLARPRGRGATAADTTLTFVGVLQKLGAGAEGVGVGEHGVDLPLFPGRPGDPDLVLGGEATGGADLLIGEEPLAGEAGDLGMHRV